MHFVLEAFCLNCTTIGILMWGLWDDICKQMCSHNTNHSFGCLLRPGQISTINKNGPSAARREKKRPWVWAKLVCPHSPGEVCHLHHDHAHLLSQHNDVVSVVIPLGHLGVQLALLFLEASHLFGNLRSLLLGQLGHDSLEEELWEAERVSILTYC